MSYVYKAILFDLCHFKCHREKLQKEPEGKEGISHKLRIYH